MSRARRVLIAAGGTGGHFYPGLVLAQTLKERGWEPLFLLRRDDPAAARLETLGLAWVSVELGGLPRRPGLELLRFGPRLVRSFRRLSRVVRDFQPEIVVGMGGYLTAPAVAAAARRGVPRAVHESNAVLGLANRAARWLGAELYWGLPPRDEDGGSRLVGTPIRPALWERGDRDAARAALGLEKSLDTVLVFGGSQGARGINREAPAALRAAANKLGRPLQALHLSGEQELEQVRKAYENSPVKAKVLPYLDSMEQGFAAADLLVCRSGASSLAELIAQRKAAVLVPFPYAAGNHQEANARALERSGAARVLLESELPAKLAGTLSDLLSSDEGPRRRAALESALGRLPLPAPRETAARLADAVEALSR